MSVICQQCGVEIGQYVEDGGRVCLQIGAVILDAAHGRCQCGVEWHWSSSEKRLEMLLENVFILRSNAVV